MFLSVCVVLWVYRLVFGVVLLGFGLGCPFAKWGVAAPLAPTPRPVEGAGGHAG